MTQSKQEVAARNAKIRAEKLRENLAKRKQQTRQRAANLMPEAAINSDETEAETGENSVG